MTEWTRRLAPATAALLLVLAALEQRGGAPWSLAAPGAASGLAAAAFSNQFYAAYLPPSEHSLHNASARFGWTNEGLSPSSIPSFPQMGTNHLR